MIISKKKMQKIEDIQNNIADQLNAKTRMLMNISDIIKINKNCALTEIFELNGIAYGVFIINIFRPNLNCDIKIYDLRNKEELAIASVIKTENKIDYVVTSPEEFTSKLYDLYKHISENYNGLKEY